jgi:hypothetical protein
VSTTVSLDGSASSGLSRSFVPLTGSLLVGAGAFSIAMRRLPKEDWTAAGSATPSWICQIAVRSLNIAIGPTLEILGENAHPTTALAIAPSGDLGSINRLIPAAAIATNARSAEKALFSTGAEGSDRSTWLIRTFPAEIAGFVVRNGRMQLPDWSQEIETRNAVD